MAGKTIVDKIQLGNSGTPANNFLISTFNDGTMKIQRGNDGGSLTDVLTIDANGKFTNAYDVAAGQLSLTANGYAKLANGLIIQWLKAVIADPATGNQSGSVALPITFPNACLSVTSGINLDAAAPGSLAMFPVYWNSANSTLSTLHFNYAEAAAGNQTNLSFRFVAIGY